jgi:hypothetical protein
MKQIILILIFLISNVVFADIDKINFLEKNIENGFHTPVNL